MASVLVVRRRRRVNPDRARRYLVRTIARPEKRYTVTPAELAETPFTRWHQSVYAYAKAKGANPVWMTQEDPVTRHLTLSWRLSTEPVQ